MENKQLFTKVAVSILIGLNVGAYYVFWPHQDGGAKPAAKKADEDKGQTKLLPTKPEQPTPKPAELPILTSVPLSIPNPKKAEFSPDEAVNKLLDHIKREKVGEKDVPPAIPMFPEDAPKLPSDKNVGVTSPLSPKVPHGPWQLQMMPEKVGAPTHVIAKSMHGFAEIHIYCDRFMMPANGAEAIATGMVTINGPGLNARCKRLIWALDGSRLVLENQVTFMPAGLESGVSTDRAVWQLPVPPMPIIAPPNPLGPPK